MGHSQSSSSSSTPSRSRSTTLTNLTNNKPTIDLGFLEPQSHIYASSLQEYSIKSVIKLILDRRLSPFYLGLNDFELEWNLNEIILALEESELQSNENIKEALLAAIAIVQDLNESNQLSTSTTNSPSTTTKKSKESIAAGQMAILHRDRLIELTKTREKLGGGGWKVSNKEEVAKLYIGRAIECPICFLYYPPPLVNTRCCDQPICTECFVQIKRADPTPTHLESEPAACPFCCEFNFGVVYNKESGRPSLTTLAETSSSSSTSDTSTPLPVVVKPKTRRKSFAHTEKEVVTTDHIHPDWEQKLEAVKATAARRANRRIVFRQVGDRLVPVGVTSGRSGDGSNATMSTGSLPAGFAAQVAAAFDSSNLAGSLGGREGRRAARKRNQEMTQYLESIGMGVGPDLEEMMVLEALRLSMLDDEERQKKSITEAETSAQGASRNSISEVDGRNTASLLEEAIDAPMTSNRISRNSSSNSNNNPLPALPIPSTSKASTSSPLFLSTSLASTSTSSSSSSTPLPTSSINSPPSQVDRPIPHSSTSLHTLPIASSSRAALEEDSVEDVSISSSAGYEALPSPPS